MAKRSQRRLTVESLERRQMLWGIDALHVVHEEPPVEGPVCADVATMEASVADSSAPQKYLGDHADPFLPNFSHPDLTCSRRTIESTVAGDWLTAVGNTGDDDIVVLRHHVTLDGSETAHTIVIADGGTLEFSRTVNSSLRVVTLQVLQGGTLDMGSTQSPIREVSAEIVFRDQPFDLELDPGQYGHGLIVLGTVTLHGRQLGQTFVESSSEVLSGQQTLRVTGDTSNWQAGDQLLLPDTRQLGYTYNVYWLDHYEKATVHSLDSDGITLTQATAFEHLGARDAGGNLVFSPHIANLSRNVLLRSENPRGVRGHTLFHHRANVDIRYAEFRDLGRTNNGVVDSTVFDASGTATHIGTNPAGRYPLHLHHLIGPESPQPNGQQFTVIGNSIHGTAQQSKWGLTIHGSSYGLVTGNVIYNMAGAGIATEDGSESFNVISENFISRIGGTRDRGKFTDGREGSGIWLRRPNNFVDNNVVTGAEKAAYAFYGGDNTTSPPVRVPAVPGTHSEFDLVPPETMTLQSFSGNVGYASHMGVELWYMGFSTYYDPTRLALPVTVVDGLDLWHINHTSIFGIQVNAFRFKDVTIIGDASLLNLYNYPLGVLIENAVNVEFSHLVVENQRHGVEAPTRVAGLDPNLPLSAVAPFTIDGGRLANETNIVITNPAQDSFVNFAPRAIMIRNVDFDRDGRKVNGTNIDMRYAPGRFTNLVQDDLVEVINYDHSGVDFRLYYHAQAPNVIVPLTGSLSNAGPGSPLGAPLPGLTNRENWERFGIAIGGAVALGDANHKDALRVPGVRGLAFPRFIAAVVDAISPDTGNPNDLVTSARRITIAGGAQPSSLVTVFRSGTPIGTVVADERGRWSFDYRAVELADGVYEFTAQSSLAGVPGELSQTRFVSVRTHAPIIEGASVQLYDDAKVGDVVARVSVTDLDPGDSFSMSLAPGTPFSIDAGKGEIRIAHPTTLVADSTYPVTVNVGDSAGLTASKTMLISVGRRPAGEHITKLHYTQFGQLIADEVAFLTPQQLASIPDWYWLSNIKPVARAALTAAQVQQLTNLGSLNAITLLTPTQRTWLSVPQIQLLRYQDFSYLTAGQIPHLTATQIASIQGWYWLASIPANSRAALTQNQVQQLTNFGSQHVISLLTYSQQRYLTTAQVRSLNYVDFGVLDATQVAQLSATQVASISDWYWLSRISPQALAGLTASQVPHLQVAPRGMISLLTSQQRAYLSSTQIRQLHYEDFYHLPDEQLLLLSDKQLWSIPNQNWFDRFSSSAIATLGRQGIIWTPGTGIVINRG